MKSIKNYIKKYTKEIKDIFNLIGIHPIGIYTTMVIYGLSSTSDPDNIRYIGKANNIKDRLKRHISNYGLIPDTHKNRWIKQELSNGEKILITELYQIKNDENWKNLEIEWIDKYKKNGFILTNLTIGGDGGMSKESIQKRNKTKVENNLLNKKEEIGKYNIIEIDKIWFGDRICKSCNKKIIHKSKSLNELIYLIRKSISRKCLSCRSKGKKLSQKSKDKISISKKNISDETRKKLSLIHKNKKVSEETKSKISATLKGKKHTDETRKKMSNPIFDFFDNANV